MAYGKEDALKTMEGIIKDKEGWHIGRNVKHEIDGMDAPDYYAKNAQKKYDELIANGYQTEANNLKNSNLEQARKYINNYYTKTGRSQFRPYMYEKGKQYGLTNQDIDNLINYDSETGEITFAGKNIGKPAGIADNRSYFDSDYMDEVWDNYVKNSGITPTKDNMAEQASNKANSYLDKLTGQQIENRDYVMNTGNEQRQKKYDFIESQQNADIFNTETAKKIMEKFDYLGGVAGGDAVADGASTNGGNIDSFSAANRARQQLAYTSAGVDAVISEYQTRMNNVMDILKSIDPQNQGEYEALNANNANGNLTAQLYVENAKQLNADNATEKVTEQAIKNDETANWATKAEVKGYFTDYSDNPYLNEDGSVKDENLDYTDLYNKAKEAGDEQAAKWTSEAAYRKILSNPEKYGKYYNPEIHKQREVSREETASMKQARMTMENERFVASLSAETQIKLQNLVNEVTKYGWDKQEVIAKINADATVGAAKAHAEGQVGAASAAAAGQVESAKINADANKYGWDAQVLMNRENNQYGLFGDMYVADLEYMLGQDQITADMVMSDDGNLTDIITTRILSGKDITTTSMNNASKEKMNSDSLASNERVNSGQWQNNIDVANINNSSKIEGEKKNSKLTTNNTSTNSSSLTKKDVSTVASNINSGFKTQSGQKYTPLKKNSDGTYSVSADKDYVVLSIMNDSNLTQNDRNLLYSSFGITEKDVNSVLNDNHYRKPQEDWKWPQ